MFSPALIIQKKRDGHPLLSSEIEWFISQLKNGSVADYQATALLMAIYFNGMTEEETVALTQAMLKSGKQYRFSKKIPHIDKHSTGGVGDKVSLILAPLVAACADEIPVRVPMMSGRGLGHTGGTLDKLESIPGFNVYLSEKKFNDVLSKIGCAMIGQSSEMVPADRKLYALRDVTATVECIPLICGSILSKKLAEGAQKLLLDIKVGNGAFMKDLPSARKLARALVSVAKKCGLPARALLTQMNQPLGYAIGNALEVKECIEILQNKSTPLSSDLLELTIAECVEMLLLAKPNLKVSQARKFALKKLSDGSAYKKFVELCKLQGGSLEKFEKQTKSFYSHPSHQLIAKQNGWIETFETEKIGRILIAMGGGRLKSSDPVDALPGIKSLKKIGQSVNKGEPIFEIYFSKKTSASHKKEIVQNLNQCFKLSNRKVKVAPLIFEKI